jgi:hypothetical protein
MDIPREVLATGQTGVRFDVDQQAVDAMEHGQGTPLRRVFGMNRHHLLAARMPVASCRRATSCSALRLSGP